MKVGALNALIALLLFLLVMPLTLYYTYTFLKARGVEEKVVQNVCLFLFMIFVLMAFFISRAEETLKDIGRGAVAGFLASTFLWLLFRLAIKFISGLTPIVTDSFSALIFLLVSIGLVSLLVILTLIVGAIAYSLLGGKIE